MNGGNGGSPRGADGSESDQIDFGLEVFGD